MGNLFCSLRPPLALARKIVKGCVFWHLTRKTLSDILDSGNGTRKRELPANSQFRGGSVSLTELAYANQGLGFCTKLTKKKAQCYLLSVIMFYIVFWSDVITPGLNGTAWYGMIWKVTNQSEPSIQERRSKVWSNLIGYQSAIESRLQPSYCHWLGGI